MKTDAQIILALSATIHMLHTEAIGKPREVREAVALASGGLRAVEEMAALLLGDDHYMTMELVALRAEREAALPPRDVEMAVVDADGDDGERWS
jgi:hypothetical protein